MSEADSASMPLTERQEAVVVSRMEGLSRPACGERHGGVTASAIKHLMERATKSVGLRNETHLWLHIATGRIPLRAAARRRLKDILG